MNQRLKRIDIEHELKHLELEKKKIELDIANDRIYDMPNGVWTNVLPDMKYRLAEIEANRERLKKILAANS